MVTQQQWKTMYEQLQDVGALNPKYTMHVFSELMLARSSNVPIAREAAAGCLERMCQEDPVAEPVLTKMYLPCLKSSRKGHKLFNGLLDRIDDRLLPWQQDRIYRTFMCDETDAPYPQITWIYQGPPTSFYRQEAIFDLLDQQSEEVGPGFRRPGYKTKIDPPEDTSKSALWRLAVHSGAFWAEHDSKSPIEYTDATYHLPAMQLLVATRTWDETHPQGPAIIVRLRQYGSEENVQKVVKIIRERGKQGGQ